MRDNIPRYIYRGENLDDIEKHGGLTFSYDAKNAPKPLLSSSGTYKASNPDIKISDSSDYLSLEKDHVNGTDLRQTEGYLPFTTSVDRAKWHATNSNNESGKVFKVDTHKLPIEQFRITKLAEQETHKKDNAVIGLMIEDEELSVIALKNAEKIPEDAIFEVIHVDASQ